MSDETTSIDLVDLANWALAGIVIVVVGAYLYRYSTRSRVSNLQGKPAPAFSQETLDGDEPVGISQFRGKVVLMDFWATWCPPCQVQAAEIKELMKREEVAQKARLLLVNTDKPSGYRRRKVRSYLEARDLDYTTVLDDGSIMRKYGVSSFPTLVVVGPDGTVTFAESGVHDSEQMARLVRQAANQ